MVARDESELAGIDELLRRGRINGVMLDAVTEREAREIESRARTVERAIFSPTTAAVDPVEVTLSLAPDAERAGVRIALDTKYLGRKDGRVRTSAGDIDALVTLIMRLRRGE